MSKKKQAVIIMTDSTGANMVGCYGNPHANTPNLDKLAQEGVRFDKAYTCQPVCGPARSALFTGIFPHSNGVWANSLPLGDNVTTLGKRLDDKGIPCAYIGKWHLDGTDYFGNGKCPPGYDPEYFYDMRMYLEELTEEERVKSRTPETMKKENISEEFTYGHRCSDRAIRYIENNKSRDFCLTVSYDEPHHPFLCPEPYASMFRGKELATPENVRDTLENKPEHQQIWAGSARFTDREEVKIYGNVYHGCNSYIDYEIGRVLEAIRQHAPDALIIFTSDHGEMQQSHCLHSKGPAPYEEITHIPLIIKGGAKDAVCPHPVSHIDIVPTVMDYFELPVPKVLEGKSLLKSIYEPKTKINDYIFIEFGRYEIDHDGFGGFQPMRCVFDGRYKLCINLLTSDELYDLQTDPGEMNNLINSEEHSETRDKLHDILLDWQNRSRDPFRGYYWETRPWRKDAKTPTWDYTGYTRQRENEEYEPRQLDYGTGLEMAEAVRPKD